MRSSGSLAESLTLPLPPSTDLTGSEPSRQSCGHAATFVDAGPQRQKGTVRRPLRTWKGPARLSGHNDSARFAERSPLLKTSTKALPRTAFAEADATGAN